MKCPKCHYLSFEPEPQCRNCGYNLELADADLQLRDEGEPPARPSPFADLELHAKARQDNARGASDYLHPYGEVDEASEREADVEAVDEPSVWVPFDAAEREAPLTGSALAAAGRPAIDEPEVDATGLPPIRRPAIAVQTVTPDPVSDGGLPPRRPAAESPRPAAEPHVSSRPPAAARREDRSHVPPPDAPTPPARRPAPRQPGRPAPTTELPLFVKSAPKSPSADEPMVKVPERPRAPVSVQRRTPDSGRLRPRAGSPSPGDDAPPGGRQAGVPLAPRADVVPPSPAAAARAGSFGKDLLEDLERIDRIGRQQLDARAARMAQGGPQIDDDRARPAARLTAAAIDLAFLGTIGIAVFFVTLRWCGLTLAGAMEVPLLPVAAFILMIVLGYLLMFTAAGGQTIGKMACGIRVTDALEDGSTAGPVSPRQAFVRAIATVPSVLALGAGFMPALVGEGRAFHDRLAQTRVVRL